MNAYYFRREKTAVLGAKKAQLRKANISCKIRGIQFRSLQFSII